MTRGTASCPRHTNRRYGSRVILLGLLSVLRLHTLQAQTSPVVAEAGPAQVPDGGEASCTAGDTALAAARWSDAVTAYQICSRLFPDNFAVFSNNGIALSRLGRMQEAIQSYERAVALDPTNEKVTFNLAVALVKAGEYAGAVKRLKQLQGKGDDLRYDELLAFCYFHLESYPLAARAAERVYAKAPEDGGNALILGAAYTRMHEFDRALPLITEAMQTAGSAEGHLIMAQTLLGLHMYHEAEAELGAIVSTQPDLPGLHSALGAVYVGTERSPLAEVEFAKALAQDPNDFEANYLLGRLKRFDGDNAAAIRYLNVANRLHPGSSEVLFELATIDIGQHHYAEAIPLLETVIKAEPDHAQAYLMLSISYQRTGNPSEAQRTGEIYNQKKRADHAQ